MDKLDKDVVVLAHRLIVGYDPTPARIDQLMAQNRSLEGLRSVLVRDFYTRRVRELLKVLETIYRFPETKEYEHERVMDEFLKHNEATDAKILAAVERRTDEYTRFHHRRFVDQLRVLSAIRTKLFGQLDSINVLDIGIMSVSGMYAEAIDGLRLYTVDYPRRTSTNAETGSPDFYPTDLETEEVHVKYPELIGKFHVIIFCEVLEHLKVDPEEILRDFKQLLAPGGRIYLTTPNGMNYGAFLTYFNMLSPVARYSQTNRSAHLENYVHVREYTSTEMVECFEKAGMRIDYQAIKEYYNPDSIWTVSYIGARGLLTYIAGAT